jgi:aryl-alcohol dehydrogenase-like predicted oxidoreductase
VWLDEIAQSLQRLKRDRLHAVLVHRVADLQKPGWQYLVEALQQAKQRGWTTRIGASVYDGDQLALAESRFRPELVQFPLNALDRRMIASGAVARLKATGTEVHARSVFLQGLLLMPPETLPEFFAPIRAKIAKLRGRWAKQALSPLEGCLAFTLQHRDVDAVIVGVNRRSEFEDIAAALSRLGEFNIDDTFDAAVEPIYLDPSRWPRFAP